ncbi:hypothetical protein [Tuwongella immobilis]|uniref:Uncharacterized protein n=1 Tax=Tuwongella immobilis TaxID=692036 RepID=A0A6C2YR19_9BACT|nr:hypothetical protein [Tuwongella immobilis]VIP03926.1 unnamed protein product [Tuwongella immobilis]VTS05219.1 unnamed protein product [Tuwongella immobilis]
MIRSRLLAHLAFGGVILTVTGCCSDRPGLFSRLRNKDCCEETVVMETVEGPYLMAPGMTVSQPMVLEPAPLNPQGGSPSIQEIPINPPSAPLGPPNRIPPQPGVQEQPPARPMPADPSMTQLNLNKTVTQPKLAPPSQ